MLAAVAGMLQAGGASVRDRIDICEKGTRRGRTTGVDESVSAILAPWSGRRRQQTRPHGGLYLMGIRCACGAAGGFRHRHFPLFIVLERGKRLLVKAVGGPRVRPHAVVPTADATRRL